MSARSKILECLWWAVPSTDNEDAKAKAAQMLDDFAHELSDLIREERENRLIHELADRIDPEVEK